LPALTRRAIAWPIDPGPMTTTTLLITMPFREVGSAVICEATGRMMAA
jgi:hypothetical protein